MKTKYHRCCCCYPRGTGSFQKKAALHVLMETVKDIFQASLFIKKKDARKNDWALLMIVFTILTQTQREDKKTFLTEHLNVEGRPEDVDENQGLVQWDIAQSPAERDVTMDFTSPHHQVNLVICRRSLHQGMLDFGRWPLALLFVPFSECKQPRLICLSD